MVLTELIVELVPVWSGRGKNLVMMAPAMIMRRMPMMCTGLICFFLLFLSVGDDLSFQNDSWGCPCPVVV